MTQKFNAPPGWPEPPRDWVPDDGWTPDLTWPDAPDGWSFWCEESPGTAEEGDSGGPLTPGVRFAASARSAGKGFVDGSRALVERARNDERLTTASDKAKALWADERTREFAKKGAKIGVVVATAALTEKGHRSGRSFLTVALAALAEQSRSGSLSTDAPGPPSSGPLHGDQVATFLAARRTDRSLPAPSTASDGATARQAPLVAARAPHAGDTPYPTVPIQLTIGPQNAFRLEHHPELTALTVEVSPTGGSDHVLSIEWKDVASRFWFDLDDLPADWQRVEHEGIAFPLRLRRTGPRTAGVSFLDPGPTARGPRGDTEELGS